MRPVLLEELHALACGEAGGGGGAEGVDGGDAEGLLGRGAHALGEDGGEGGGVLGGDAREVFLQVFRREPGDDLALGLGLADGLLVAGLGGLGGEGVEGLLELGLELLAEGDLGRG